MFAESVSMLAVAFTSKQAEGEFYRSERAREFRHIARVPNLERQEIRVMFEKLGFKVLFLKQTYAQHTKQTKEKSTIQGDLLNQVVSQITENADSWVDVMLSEEHKVQPVTRKDALISALFVFVAALIGSVIPLIPFFFASPSTGIWISIGVSSAALFALGAYNALIFRIGNWFLKGLELTAIGVASAMVGWGIGIAFARLWPS